MRLLFSDLVLFFTFMKDETKTANNSYQTICSGFILNSRESYQIHHIKYTHNTVYM